MAGQRLTDKTELTEQLASDDLLMCVDASDTTGSAAGTSKKVLNKYIIQTDKVSLSNANVLDLENTPITLVAAPGSGYMVFPLSVTLVCTYAASTETGSVNMYIGYSNASALYYWGKKYRVMYGATTDVVVTIGADYNINRGVHSTTISNLPLMVWTDVTYNGGWTADVYTTYQVVKLP